LARRLKRSGHTSVTDAIMGYDVVAHWIR